MNPFWILLGAQWVLGWDSRHSEKGRAVGRGVVPFPCALIQCQWLVAPLHPEMFFKTTLQQGPNSLTCQSQLSTALAKSFLHLGFWIFSLSCVAFPLTCIYQCYWNNRGLLNRPKEEKPLSTAVFLKSKFRRGSRTQFPLGPWIFFNYGCVLYLFGFYSRKEESHKLVGR